MSRIIMTNQYVGLSGMRYAMIHFQEEGKRGQYKETVKKYIFFVFLS